MVSNKKEVVGVSEENPATPAAACSGALAAGALDDPAATKAHPGSSGGYGAVVWNKSSTTQDRCFHVNVQIRKVKGLPFRSVKQLRDRKIHQ
jgi:hypothetical protein